MSSLVMESSSWTAAISGGPDGRPVPHSCLSHRSKARSHTALRVYAVHTLRAPLIHLISFTAALVSWKVYTHNALEVRDIGTFWRLLLIRNKWKIRKITLKYLFFWTTRIQNVGSCIMCHTSSETIHVIFRNGVVNLLPR